MGEIREHGAGSAGIVVGVDGSPLSVEALRWAARLAAGIGGQITAVMAWEYPANAVMGSFPGAEWDPEQDAEQRLHSAARKAFGDPLPEGLSLETVQGPARHVLLERSRDAELLVLGSRGLGGFRGMLLGSVSAACAEHATCPVLVLHGSGPAGAATDPAAAQADAV